LSEIRHALAERRWAAERKDLLSRVQAGTLRDYACNKPLLDPPAKQAVDAQAGPSIEEMTSLSADAAISEEELVSAQSSYRSGMG